MKNLKSISSFCFALSAMLCLFTSCSPTIYNANALNAPLLSQKGNVKASLGATLSDYGLTNTNLQGAFAATDHLGFMVNGMYHAYKRSGRPERHREAFAEAGLGYFSTIGNSSKWRWECYGGFGFGKARETYTPSNDLILSSPYKRFFVQPSIGFVSPYFEAALTVRGSYLSVGEIDWAGDETNGKTVSGALWEPCLTIRAGRKRIKPFLQYSWLLPEATLSPVIDFEGFLAKILTVQLGVCVNFKE